MRNTTNFDSDWLGAIDDWSRDNSGHAPITLVIDLKDDKTDNRSYAEGNLGALNAKFKDAFGNRMFEARDMGSRGSDWPVVGALRDQFIIVISGNEDNRPLNH